MDTLNKAQLDRSNILPLPKLPLAQLDQLFPKEILTPFTDSLVTESKRLDSLSQYKSQFDWQTIRDLEVRNAKRQVRGGIVFKSPMRLVNAHSSCQQCLYAFEVDTYGRGCVHNCVYCYAKETLTRYGYWNNPYPVPVDINSIRKVFYTVFETDRKTEWREIMEKRIPIRIGSMSDSFMWMDEKIKVTKEFIRILNHYKYPHIIFTRSDLVAQPDYMKLLDPKLTSIQFSISSTNDLLNRLIEPGAPSAKRRLSALKTLNENGFWTTVRINPLFPIHPDGYFTNPNFSWTDGPIPKFDFTSFEMVDEIADTGTPAILVGFVRLSRFAIKAIFDRTKMDLWKFFDPSINKKTSDQRYSDRETRYYYEEFKRRCISRAVEFTTCYIGNGEPHFWKDQDLWSNKSDCCNAKNRLSTFVTDSREIPFSTRTRFTSQKDAKPANNRTIHEPLGENPKIKSPSIRPDHVST